MAKNRAFLGQFLVAERRIFAYILTLLPHRADAEDVMQEVSMLMWEKYDELDPPEDFAAWGCRIAYSVASRRSSCWWSSASSPC